MNGVTYKPIANLKLVVAILLTIGACLALADRASAVGQITYDGCLANGSADGCVDLPGSPLTGAAEVATSPDNKSVYAVAATADTVSHFFRGGPDGQISYDGCLNNDGSSGCVDLPGTPLSGASGVAASPDGKSVYVASKVSDSVSHFFRGGPDGQISYDGCLNNDGSSGCVDLPGTPIDDARSVAVSPDGKSVYLASAGSDSVAHFFRSTSGGQISYDGCLNDDGSSGCVDLPGTPLSAAISVAVSPDGKSVYVASFRSDSVAHFFRGGPSGQISYDGCLASDATRGCGALPVDALDGARSVDVSPDVKSVYAASTLSNSVTHFFRGGPDGQLSFDGCLASDGSDGCGDLPGVPLTGAADVTTSPDGQSVYVASSFSSSIAHFFRGGPDGQISYDGCLNNDGSSGCVDLPGNPLFGVAGAAVSPDGKSVYASAVDGAAVSHFFRAPALQPDPDPRGDTAAPDTLIEKAPKRRRRRPAAASASARPSPARRSSAISTARGSSRAARPYG